jgi:hypothetical protein
MKIQLLLFAIFGTMALSHPLDGVWTGQFVETSTSISKFDISFFNISFVSFL